MLAVLAYRGSSNMHSRMPSPCPLYPNRSVALLPRVQVYGGGHFKSNNRLNISVTHLLAIYSGGKLSHNHAGYKTKEGRQGNQFDPSEGPGQGTGDIGGASGAGFGGNGGRGTQANRVGQFYGSLYSPSEYGSAGGFGQHYGKFLYAQL